MFQFIVILDESGNRVFVNLTHVKKVAEQKNLNQAAIWVEGDQHPLMVHDKEFANVMAVFEKHCAHS